MKKLRRSLIRLMAPLCVIICPFVSLKSDLCERLDVYCDRDSSHKKRKQLSEMNVSMPDAKHAVFDCQTKHRRPHQDARTARSHVPRSVPHSFFFMLTCMYCVGQPWYFDLRFVAVLHTTRSIVNCLIHRLNQLSHTSCHHLAGWMTRKHNIDVS